MKIGLFGGAFNPIHNGHIEVADLVLKNFPELSDVFFIPSFGNRRHKTIGTSFKDRVNMVINATLDRNEFKVLAIEEDIYKEKVKANKTKLILMFICWMFLIISKRNFHQQSFT